MTSSFPPQPITYKQAGESIHKLFMELYQTNPLRIGMSSDVELLVEHDDIGNLIGYNAVGWFLAAMYMRGNVEYSQFEMSNRYFYAYFDFGIETFSTEFWDILLECEHPLTIAEALYFIDFSLNNTNQQDYADFSDIVWSQLKIQLPPWDKRFKRRYPL